MDIANGLSAVSTAIGIARELRGVGRSLDGATFMLKIAELKGALADAKIALSDAKTEIARLEQEVKAVTEGDPCPICRVGRLSVASVEPLGQGAWEWHNCRCNADDCDYSNKRFYSTTEGCYKNAK